MKMYDYLIAYDFSADKYLTPCRGTMKFSSKTKIKTFEDVSDVEKYITSQIEGAKNLAIYNIVFLGRNKH